MSKKVDNKKQAKVESPIKGVKCGTAVVPIMMDKNEAIKQVQFTSVSKILSNKHLGIPCRTEILKALFGSSSSVKITGRYGSMGVVCSIWPDEDTPVSSEPINIAVFDSPTTITDQHKTSLDDYKAMKAMLDTNLSPDGSEFAEEITKRYKQIAFENYIEMIRCHAVPEDFNEWELCNLEGWTIKFEANWSLAHEAALVGHPLTNFKKLDLADGIGTTVAHLIALHRHLPEDFTQWNLCNEDGTTVAHVAAEYGHLPDNFNQWELYDKYGRTVKFVNDRYKAEPKAYVSPYGEAE